MLWSNLLYQVDIVLSTKKIVDIVRDEANNIHSSIITCIFEPTHMQGFIFIASSVIFLADLDFNLVLIYYYFIAVLQVSNFMTYQEINKWKDV